MAKSIVYKYDDAQEVATKVVEALIAKINTIVEETGNCVVALSGGNTPKKMFKILAETEYKEQLDWDKVYFLWVDERFVPHTDEASNYGAARDLLFSKILGAVHTFPVPTRVATVEEAASLYEKEVRTVLSLCGKDAIDIVMLGLGSDGHTASLFPKSKALEEENALVAAVTDGKNWERITMTVPCLIQAKNLWFVIVGEDKTAALARVMQQAESYKNDEWQKRVFKVLPAAILPLERAVFYIDEEVSI